MVKCQDESREPEHSSLEHGEGELNLKEDRTEPVCGELIGKQKRSRPNGRKRRLIKLAKLKSEPCQPQSTPDPCQVTHSHCELRKRVEEPASLPDPAEENVAVQTMDTTMDRLLYACKL